MPGFDKTGPKGKGALTGRQMGRCNPESGEPMERPRWGRGRRRWLRNDDQENISSLGRMFRRRR